MKIEISIGEAIDKLSILEIKMKKITDENKKIEIQKEINVLQDCEIYKSKNEFYYDLLVYVNEKIWDMTDIIKSITVEDTQFSHISNKIFEFNQKRFRIKNWFNLLTESNIKEQKSYALSHCRIVVDNEDVFFDKLPEINYLSIEYDVLTFECSFISTIQEFLKIPTILYDEEQIKHLNTPTIIYLKDFSIPTSESSEIFSLKPIIYINGGLLGDFIQSLSVICEKFYETCGRKGILYISNIGDTFRNGLENTYNDIYPVIIKQKYIKEFKIYNNESYDIDLVKWRYDDLVFKTSWSNIYNNNYNVCWGKHKWLETLYNDKWKDKVIINTTNYRFPYNIDFKLLNELHPNNLIYISSSKDTHIYFENKTQLYINYYQVNDFLELATIINSCKLFVGSISMPFSVANALHKPRICGLAKNIDQDLDKNWDNIHNLELDKYLPNVWFSV